jgi:hypothetical protein
VVSAVGAGEPHASLDARDGVEPLHSSECMARSGEVVGTSGEQRR